MGDVIEYRDLKLVDASTAATRTARGFAAAVVATLAAMALLATALGADRSRAPLDARRHVADTLNLALTEGNGAPEVIERLRQLRDELGRRPLDSKSRVRYAALLLAMTRSLDDTRAAAFHAGAAAELAPVTFPVVELAALILARSGEVDVSLALVREAFAFDPAGAAGLLLQLEDRFVGRPPEAILGQTPAGWIAWSRVLVAEGRGAEAGELLDAAIARWPRDLELLVALARRATLASEWDTLGRRVEALDEIPGTARGLELLAYRARWHAESGRREEAGDDLREVLASGGDTPSVLILAGDALQRLEDSDEARRLWHRALYRIPTDRAGMRVAILVRLAELEDRDGRASVALRHWRAVLEIEPGHPRARRRVAELTGFET